MRSYNHGRFRQQANFLRRQFLQDDALPFTDVLSESAVAQALKALDVVWLDRIYSPLVTLWVFLGQVLGQDHSCRAAVATGQIALNRDYANADRRNTIRCSTPGT